MASSQLRNTKGPVKGILANGSSLGSNLVDPSDPNYTIVFDSSSTVGMQSALSVPFGAPSCSTPGTFIYDSTQPMIYGDLYPTWNDTLSAAINYGGLAHIFIQNGSVIPAATYDMPNAWDLTIDGYGTILSPGLVFNSNPVSITVLHYGTVSCNANDGESTFLMTNPTMTISGADLVLGEQGNLIADVNDNGYLVIDNTVITTSGQTLFA